MNPLVGILHDVPKISYETNSGSTGGRVINDAGKRTPRPNMATLEVTPVTRCTVVRYAAMMVGVYEASFLDSHRRTM